ncbi:hypothetical protein NPIL_140191 [Nephila pilipes]|uniref:Uncharacterized protein n=1 Tax=Nephila pilipes TaxID=299642 RepID=A0A8X6QJH9_NEPPI|nr:hypothetical protein NPIL_140191 [Nephila pilipes]
MFFTWVLSNKNRRGGDFVQTTKKLYDFQSLDQNNHYEMTLQVKSKFFSKESEAADREFLKYTLVTAPEELIKLPSTEGGYYYIPDQNQRWNWRRTYFHVLEPTPSAIFHDQRPFYYKENLYGEEKQQGGRTESKYSFHNKHYKVLIK